MARPSEYDFEICVEICDQLAEGLNIKRILDSKESYPNWSTFRRWKQNNEELRTLYINSQQDKAIALENELDDLRDLLSTKEIDASTYNVLAQTIKWKMAKFYPKVFGDKVQNEVTVMNIPVLTNDPLADTNESDNSTQENIST
jgi:cell shape-determining protein MreC